MDKEELKELFKKYHEGTCTEEEKALLEAWYLQHNEEQETVLSYRKLKAVKDLVFRELPGNHHHFLKIGFRLAAAAAVVGIVITTTVHYLPPYPTVKPHELVDDVLPGKNKAVLKLANGKTIDLTDAQTGTLISSNGIVIAKNKTGQIMYQITGENAKDTTLSTLETPRGGQWKVQLPDGTNVWLNAATTLIFPTSFAQLKDRKVTLSGEAYFEVARDKAHPFIVTSKGQEVRVLGTHFNINAYPDEPSSKTTLAEGSVKIKTDGAASAKYLKPGEQAIVTGNQIAIGQADLQEDLSWVNGQFWFNDESIESVMRKLSRWYDIDVEYQGEPSRDGLNGRISRYKNISQVLKALEATQTIHFKMEGRRVTVMK